jgi:hypothetical protein
MDEKILGLTPTQQKQINWYEWLAAEAAKHNISVRELCKRAGYDHDRVYRYKNGNPKSVSVVFDLENALNDHVTNGHVRHRRARKLPTEE